MRALKRRIDRLTRTLTVTPRVCPECGHGPGRHMLLEMEVVFGEPDGLVPERCPSCGRQLVFKLAFDKGG